MENLKKAISSFEIHDISGLRECFENGLNPNLIVDDKPLVYQLINMYFRSPRFKKCIELFLEYGLIFEDKILFAVLADNPILLDEFLNQNKSLLNNKYKMDCTFTPLFEASLLHICAEYNHVNCAQILIKYGANINEKAGFDEHGFGGQSPIFHTVNQDANKCMDMLKLLLENGVDLNIQVKGLIWGKGYEWETFIPEVNPISYAMMGLLRQFQRQENDVYEVIELLYKSKYGVDYKPLNVPNKYLHN